MRVHFCFCYNTSWYAILAPVISYFEKLIRVSHFAIIIESDFGRKIVYESVWPKTRKIEFEQWSKTYEVRDTYSFKVPTHKQYEVYEWLQAQRNKNYPMSQLVFILATIVNKSFEKLSFGWILNGSKWLICTELGSRFVEKFFRGVIDESHDRIGLKDMLDISKQLEMSQDIWKE